MRARNQEEGETKSKNDNFFPDITLPVARRVMNETRTWRIEIQVNEAGNSRRKGRHIIWLRFWYSFKNLLAKYYHDRERGWQELQSHIIKGGYEVVSLTASLSLESIIIMRSQKSKRHVHSKSSSSFAWKRGVMNVKKREKKEEKRSQRKWEAKKKHARTKKHCHSFWKGWSLK